jgi:hypothetical protein
LSLLLLHAAVRSGSGGDVGGERCGALGEPHWRGRLARLILVSFIIYFFFAPTNLFLSLSHRFMCFSSCRNLLMCVQAKASKDLFPFAGDNNLAGVKECIMNGANVDEYKDAVREKKP